MPQVAVGGLLIGGASIASGGLTLAGLSAAFTGAGLVAAVAQFGAGLVLSGIAQEFMPKPKASLTGRTVSVRQPVAPREIVYGATRKGGTVVFLHETGAKNEYLHLVIALAGHEVNKIGAVYFDGVEVVDDVGTVSADYTGLILLEKKLGTASQTAFAQLVADAPDKWTADHRLRGVACVHLRLKFSNAAFPSGLPNITFDIEGKNDIYDPRTLTTGYTTNAALCVADYMSLTRYGLGIAHGAEDGIASADLIEAANICDENVTLSGGATLEGEAGGTLQSEDTGDDLNPEIGGGASTEKRYSCNGVVSLSQRPMDIIQAMLTAMAGKAIWQGSDWKIRAGAYRTPTITLTGDDITDGGLTLATRVSRSENFNGVRGQFVSPDNDYQPDDFPAYQSATYLTEDGGEESWYDLILPFTSSAATAQRLAKIRLETTRRQQSIVINGKFSAWRAATGETFNINYDHFGFSSKPFDVVEVGLGVDGASLLPTIRARETSSLVYSWTATEEQIYAAAPSTTFPNPFNVSAVGLAVAAGIALTAEKVTNVLTATVTASEPLQVASVELQFKKSASAAWITFGRGDLGDFEIRDIEADTYDFRARGINGLGIAGEWTTIANYRIAPSVTPPADVANLQATVMGPNILLEWDPITNLDLSHYVLRHALEESGATYANATTIIAKIARPASSVMVPAQPGTYMIRAVNKSGAVSENYSAVIVPEVDLEDFTTTLTQTEETAFSGTKTDCSVVTSALEITYPSEATHLLQQSEDMTAAHTATNITVTANDITAPDGNLTADKITGSNGGSALEHRNNVNTVTVEQNQAYHYSIYAKEAEFRYLRLFVFHDTGVNDKATFDLQTGTIVSDGTYNGSAVIEPAQEGFYRIGIDVKNTIDTTSNFSVYLSPDGTTFSYDATTFPGGIHLWGENATKGEGAKTYQPVFSNVFKNEAQYDFSTYIDTTAVRRVRARVDVNVIRDDNSGGLFDDASGLFDARAGLFDDTSGDEYADTDVLTWIRTTNDDPSASPTWSAYKLFRAGDFSGRAFDFRVTLKTASHDVTPRVTGLTARVQY